MTGPVCEIAVVELLGGFGDLLIALPMIHALHAAHPEAALRVVTFAPGSTLLAHDPAVTEVTTLAAGDPVQVRSGVVAQLERCRPDLAITTTRYGGVDTAVEQRAERAVTNLWRSPPADQLVDRRFLRLLIEDRVLPLSAEGTPLRVVLHDAELHAGRELLGDCERPLMVLPGSGMAVKTWPAERWAALIEAAGAAGHSVLTTSGGRPTPLGPLPSAPAGRLRASPSPPSAEGVRTSPSPPSAGGVRTSPPPPSAGRLRALPPLSLRQLAAVLAAVGDLGGVAVGGDTGPVRLATAVGCPTVSLFGPTLASRYAPHGPGAVALQGLPGCEVRRPTAITEQECWWTAACPLTDTRAPACMHDISVADVLAAVERVGAPA